VLEKWRRARDSNPQGPRGPVDFKSCPGYPLPPRSADMMRGSTLAELALVGSFRSWLPESPSESRLGSRHSCFCGQVHTSLATAPACADRLGSSPSTPAGNKPVAWRPSVIRPAPGLARGGQVFSERHSAEDSLGSARKNAGAEIASASVAGANGVSDERARRAQGVRTRLAVSALP